MRQQRLYVRPRESGALSARLHSHAGYSARGQLYDTRGASGVGQELPEKGVQ